MLSFVPLFLGVSELGEPGGSGSGWHSVIPSSCFSKEDTGLKPLARVCKGEVGKACPLNPGPGLLDLGLNSISTDALGLHKVLPLGVDEPWHSLLGEKEMSGTLECSGIGLLGEWFLLSTTCCCPRGLGFRLLPLGVFVGSEYLIFESEEDN